MTIDIEMGDLQYIRQALAHYLEYLECNTLHTQEDQANIKCIYNNLTQVMHDDCNGKLWDKLKKKPITHENDVAIGDDNFSFNDHDVASHETGEHLEQT